MTISQSCPDLESATRMIDRLFLEYVQSRKPSRALDALASIVNTLLWVVPFPLRCFVGRFYKLNLSEPLFSGINGGVWIVMVCGFPAAFLVFCLAASDNVLAGMPAPPFMVFSVLLAWSLAALIWNTWCCAPSEYELDRISDRSAHVQALVAPYIAERSTGRILMRGDVRFLLPALARHDKVCQDIKYFLLEGAPSVMIEQDVFERLRPQSPLPMVLAWLGNLFRPPGRLRSDVQRSLRSNKHIATELDRARMEDETPPATGSRRPSRL